MNVEFGMRKGEKREPREREREVWRSDYFGNNTN
jgi:hypothetical protein